MLRIFANSLFLYYLDTLAFICIFVMWDYFYVFMCACDVSSRGASDLFIKRRLSIFT